MCETEEDKPQLAISEYDQETERIIRRNDVLAEILALQERSRLWTPASPPISEIKLAIEKATSNLAEATALSQRASYFRHLPAEPYHLIFGIPSSKDGRDHILREYQNIHNP